MIRQTEAWTMGGPEVPAAADATAPKAGSFRFLLRDGAYVVLAHGATGDAVAAKIFSPRNGFASPLATLAPCEADRACRAGHLARVAGYDNRWSLTRSGRQWVRRAMTQSSPPDAPARQRAKQARHSRDAVDRPVMRTSPAGPAMARDTASPLVRLHQRSSSGGQPLISDIQLQAGLRLARDFHFAGLQPRVTSRWDAPASDGRRMGGELSDNALAARERFNTAIAAVSPELVGLLIDVCCFESGLESAEQAERLPRRSGKIVLDFALTALARHYGLLAPAQPARIQRWLASI